MALVRLRELLAARAQRRRDDERFRPANAHAFSNQQELLRSDTAGCFYCLSFFKPREEDLHYMEVDSSDDGDWADVPVNGTAWCPRCAMDSVIGSASGYPMTDEFMEELHGWAFDRVHVDVAGLLVLIAVASASVLAVVLAVVYLPLPWGRILLALAGLALAGVGVHGIVSGEIKLESLDPENEYTVEGGWALVLGIVIMLAGSAVLAAAVFGPWG